MATMSCPLRRATVLKKPCSIGANGRSIMQIYGPAHLHGPQSVNAPHANRLAQPATPARPSADTADTVEISSQADAASRLSEIPDIRHDRVAAIKAQIQAGTYETADKLDAALEALLDEIG
jgi:negative regulator of flagellin synthesis FlgM